MLLVITFRPRIWLAAVVGSVGEAVRWVATFPADVYEVWDATTERSVALLVSHGDGRVSVQE